MRPRRRALDYLNFLSKKEGLEQCYDLKKPMAVWSKGLDCKGYRLPTEAEWEYAARGGNDEPRYGELDDIGWHWDNSGGEPKPVGKKEKNDYDLYDMLGSPWEWTWDLEDYSPFTGEMTDPIIGGMEQKSESESHIVRGGSYARAASTCAPRTATKPQPTPATATTGSARCGPSPRRSSQGVLQSEEQSLKDQRRLRGASGL